MNYELWTMNYGLGSAEGYILEGEGRDELCLPRVGIVGNVTHPLPHLQHVASDVHAANRLNDSTILDEESLDAIREVARHRVAIAPIEVGDKDSSPPYKGGGGGGASWSFHYQPMYALCGRLHSQFLPHGCVDEVSLQATFLEEFPPLSGNTIVIE